MLLDTYLRDCKTSIDYKYILLKRRNTGESLAKKFFVQTMPQRYLFLEPAYAVVTVFCAMTLHAIT